MLTFHRSDETKSTDEHEINKILMAEYELARRELVRTKDALEIMRQHASIQESRAASYEELLQKARQILIKLYNEWSGQARAFFSPETSNELWRVVITLTQKTQKGRRF